MAEINGLAGGMEEVLDDVVAFPDSIQGHIKVFPEFVYKSVKCSRYHGFDCYRRRKTGNMNKGGSVLGAEVSGPEL